MSVLVILCAGLHILFMSSFCNLYEKKIYYMFKGQKYVISHRSIFTVTYNENVKKNTFIVLFIKCSIFS